jgi:hypothetical protein
MLGGGQSSIIIIISRICMPNCIKIFRATFSDRSVCSDASEDQLLGLESTRGEKMCIGKLAWRRSGSDATCMGCKQRNLDTCRCMQPETLIAQGHTSPGNERSCCRCRTEVTYDIVWLS